MTVKFIISLQVTFLTLLLYFTEPSSAKNAVSLTSTSFISGDNNAVQPVFNNTEGRTSWILVPVGEPEPENDGEWSEAEDWPEPGPRWNEVYEEWGLAWEIHIYGFSACFFLVFLYASYFVVVNLADGLRKKYLSFSLNITMVICGFTRSFVLALDPYHQGTKLANAPIVLIRILWSLTDPCLTSADSLVILSLLETYRLSIAPQRFQKMSTVFPIIMIHFVWIFVSDLVVSEFVEAKAMLVFCQVFFITWCAILGICYFVIGFKLDKMLFRSSVQGNREITSDEGRWYIYLIHASGVSNIVTCAVYIYSAAGVFGVYSDVEFVDAWPWWSLQTALRVTELIAAVLVFTVSAKRAQPDAKGAQTAQSNAAEASGTPTQGKKRKLSMFSALRSHAPIANDAAVTMENYQLRSNMLQDEGQEFCVHEDQGTMGPNSESGSQGQELQENQLEKKNSMFTALGDIAKMVEHESNL